MEMIEYIKGYYDSERSMALIGAAVGLLLLLIGIIAIRQHGTAEFNRGLAYTLIVCVLLFLSGLGLILQNNKKLAEVASSKQTNIELQQSEIKRVEHVLATGYRASSITASILIVAGLSLLLLSSNNLLRGIGMGILIAGTAIHTIDFFSINKHKSYYSTIKALKY